jgi:hypothetical protein
MSRQLRVNQMIALVAVLVSAFTVNAQGARKTQTGQVASATNPTKTVPATNSETTSAYIKFTGVRLGMSTDEVRKKLGNLKAKGERQDFFEFSDAKSAQVFYDSNGNAVAISFDYLGNNSGAPTPEAVVGQPVEPKADGTIYAMKRFPEAGYWIAYSRTAGENPITSVTVQKI